MRKDALKEERNGGVCCENEGGLVKGGTLLIERGQAMGYKVAETCTSHVQYAWKNLDTRV